MSDAYRIANYHRIEKAIAYLVDRAAVQPDLAAVAAHVNLSPYHFQRLFCQWAGITPKRFLQALTLERSKFLLQDSLSLLAVAHAVGLSGSSRLHDHFVQLDGVTPGEFKLGGSGVIIDYGIHASPFGEIFVAATQRGVCRAGFMDHSTQAEQLAELHKAWPGSTVQRNDALTRPIIEAMFGANPPDNKMPISVHVTGTNFQIAVWRSLLAIPPGALASYSHLAAKLGRPTASRAVANAVGANPVALIIPCHRIIRQSGALGGYRWGTTRKQMVQAWEWLRMDPE